jgi:predicted transcriptional regulator
MATKHSTFRLDDQTLSKLAGLAEALHISRSEVLRQAISAFRDFILVAQADAGGVLATLRERYGDEAEVALSVGEGADGEPEALVKVDGVERPDLGARAMQ